MATKVESLQSGRGIQVVAPNEDHTFAFDEDTLSSILLREDVRDLHAVVISVAGPFRKGKSFLLDFFLRYLHHEYNLSGSGDWMGSEDEPLQGFSWRGGSDRDTTGLLLWSQPFKATLSNGEKVVIFLMDTQGTFDSTSTVRDNATVFALSTMLSSVQIYNLSQNIEEDDLQHLQLFTEYGRLAQQGGGGHQPFQRLQLLVRDWSVPYEYPYGAVGGQNLLTRRLEVNPNQHEELQSLRRHVAACFQQLACFLMPHPGFNVSTNPNFNGKLADISAEFKTALKELAPMLLAPDNLVPKSIEGQKVKAKDLLIYFKAYMKIFNGTELPEPKTILEATAEANNLSAASEAQEVYGTLMEEAAGGARPYLPPPALQREHRRARDKALHAFHAKRKMGGDQLSQAYCEQLEQAIEEQYEKLRAHNESKNLFKIVGTPMVLAAAALLCYLLASLCGLLGLQSLDTVAQTAAIAALVMIAVWMYSRITGNMRELAVQLDEVTGSVRDYFLNQTMNRVSQRAAAAVGYSGDKKDT